MFISKHNPMLESLQGNWEDFAPTGGPVLLYGNRAIEVQDRNENRLLLSGAVIKVDDPRET
jgi:hypothetical protein